MKSMIRWMLGWGGELLHTKAVPHGPICLFRVNKDKVLSVDIVVCIHNTHYTSKQPGMINNFSTLTNGFFSIFTIVSSLTNCLVSGLYRCRTTRSAGIAWMLCFAHTSSSAIAYRWNSNMWWMVFICSEMSHIRYKFMTRQRMRYPVFSPWQLHDESCVCGKTTINFRYLYHEQQNISFYYTPLTFLEDFSVLPPGHTSQMPLCSFRLWIVPP